MNITFEQALEIAKSKYLHPINHYLEYKDYFVFELDDGSFADGGTTSPIVIRKADGLALKYAPIFLNVDIDSEDPGEVLSEGRL